MLPDTIHRLPVAERFAYAKVLAFVTRIDGELTTNEMVVFEQRLGSALLPPSKRKELRDFLKNPPSLKQSIGEMGEEARLLAFRDSCLMSAVDGEVDEKEREVLDLIAEHIGLDEEIVDKVLEWVLRGYKWMKEGYEILSSGEGVLEE